MFFHAYMYGPLQGKLRLYKARNVHVPGKVISSDWEVFASILMRDAGSKLGKGVDLANHEVKSSENGGAYEYQYHKKSGHDKLKSDRKAGHLFFQHSDNLRLVELWHVAGAQATTHFDKWLKEYPIPYQQQRFRRSISHNWVRTNGTLLMRLREGEIDYPELDEAKPKEAAAGIKPNSRISSD